MVKGFAMNYDLEWKERKILELLREVLEPDEEEKEDKTDHVSRCPYLREPKHKKIGLQEYIRLVG